MTIFFTDMPFVDFEISSAQQGRVALRFDKNSLATVVDSN